VPTTVKVRPIKLSPWKGYFKPAEDLLVPDMHPQGDLSLPAVPTEVALADEQSDHEPLLEVAEAPRRFHGKHDGETVQDGNGVRKWSAE